MAIRDTPAQCEIGDGVLATNVLMLDEFHTTRTVTQFTPGYPAQIFQAHPINEKPVKVDQPKPWIFALRDYQGEDGQVVPAWLRES